MYRTYRNVFVNVMLCVFFPFSIYHYISDYYDCYATTTCIRIGLSSIEEGERSLIQSRLQSTNQSTQVQVIHLEELYFLSFERFNTF